MKRALNLMVLGLAGAAFLTVLGGEAIAQAPPNARRPSVIRTDWMSTCGPASARLTELAFGRMSNVSRVVVTYSRRVCIRLQKGQELHPFDKKEFVLFDGLPSEGQRIQFPPPGRVDLPNGHWYGRPDIMNFSVYASSADNEVIGELEFYTGDVISPLPKNILRISPDDGSLEPVGGGTANRPLAGKAISVSMNKRHAQAMSTLVTNFARAFGIRMSVSLPPSSIKIGVEKDRVQVSSVSQSVVVDGPDGRQTSSVLIEFQDGTIGRDGVARGKAVCQESGGSLKQPAQWAATWEARPVDGGYQLCLLPGARLDGGSNKDRYLDLAGLTASSEGTQLKGLLAPYQPRDLMPKWDFVDDTPSASPPDSDSIILLDQIAF
jgi:hypothetical protein